MRLRLAAAFLLLLAAPAAAAPVDVVGRGAEVLARDVRAVTDPHAHDAEVAAFEGSATAATLRFQHALAGDVGMVDAPWIGTHNAFNSIAEMGPALSAADANQQLTLVDQLRLGVRSLELDVHQWLGRPAVCHGATAHAGCTIERSFASVLAPVAEWIRAHPGEVVLLYLEHHLDDEAGEAAVRRVLDEQLGALLHRPGGDACTQLPDTLTRDDVLAAGARVVAVGTCGGGAWNGAVHGWDRHVESRPAAFDAASCGPDFTPEDYATRLVRYFEDSTFVTTAAAEAGAASRDDGLTAQTVRAMARCGVDLLGLDQLLPGDGRLEALAWSWADGVPSGGACAVARGADGRWATGSCRTPRAACRTATGTWRVARTPLRCRRLGAVFAAPRTARENALLHAVAGDRPVLLGLRRAGATWTALDRR